MKTPKNLLLWEVHFMSSYWDGEDTVPVDKRLYIPAKTYEEAMRKAEPSLAKLRKEYKAASDIKVTVCPLENLILARNSENDGRLGWHSTHDLSEVELSLPEDKKKYRLAVCLVPIT